MPLAFYCGHAKLGKGKSGGQKGRGRRSREQSARIIELSAGAAAAGWGWNKTKVVKIMIALAPEQRLSFALSLLSTAFPCFPLFSTIPDGWAFSILCGAHECKCG